MLVETVDSKVIREKSAGTSGLKVNVTGSSL